MIKVSKSYMINSVCHKCNLDCEVNAPFRTDGKEIRGIKEYKYSELKCPKLISLGLEYVTT
jgi:hypothetical protein